MREKYEEECGAEVDSASDIAIRMRVLAGEIYNMQTNLEWLKRQMFPSTADGRYLDNFAAMRGLERKPAKKSRGQLRFSLREVKNTAVTIPAGTVVSTDTGTPLRFYTVEDGEISAGTYSAMVNAEAEEPGFKGNIKINTAVVAVNVPSEIDAVTNPSVFIDGRDAESDSALRERIQESYRNTPNGMNKQYYIDLATSVDGVDKAGVISRLNGVGSVSIFVSGVTGYISDEKILEVKRLINKHRELNVDVSVARATSREYDLDIKVIARTGFSTDEVTEKCTDAFVSYIDTIPVGGKLYLSGLGKYLLETGCIENYEFGPTMENSVLSGSMYFVPGEIEIEVV